MQYRAELNYTLKDLRRFEKIHLKLRSRIAFYAVRILLIVVTVAVLGACAALLYFRAFDGEMIRRFALLLVLYAFLFALKELRVRAALKSLSAQGCVTLTADEDGMRAEAKSLSTSIGYEGFCDLVHSGDTYYFYIDKRKAQILPERCFTEGDPAAFGAFIEEKTGLKIREIK